MVAALFALGEVVWRVAWAKATLWTTRMSPGALCLGKYIKVQKSSTVKLQLQISLDQNL